MIANISPRARVRSNIALNVVDQYPIKGLCQRNTTNMSVKTWFIHWCILGALSPSTSAINAGIHPSRMLVFCFRLVLIEAYVVSLSYQTLVKVLLYSWCQCLMISACCEGLYHQFRYPATHRSVVYSWYTQLEILVLCGSCLWLMLDTSSFVRVCCLIGTDSIIDTRPQMPPYITLVGIIRYDYDTSKMLKIRC